MAAFRPMRDQLAAEGRSRAKARSRVSQIPCGQKRGGGGRHKRTFPHQSTRFLHPRTLQEVSFSTTPRPLRARAVLYCETPHSQEAERPCPRPARVLSPRPRRF